MSSRSLYLVAQHKGNQYCNISPAVQQYALIKNRHVSNRAKSVNLHAQCSSKLPAAKSDFCQKWQRASNLHCDSMDTGTGITLHICKAVGSKQKARITSQQVLMGSRPNEKNFASLQAMAFVCCFHTRAQNPIEPDRANPYHEKT